MHYVVTTIPNLLVLLVSRISGVGCFLQVVRHSKKSGLSDGSPEHDQERPPASWQAGLNNRSRV